MKKIDKKELHMIFQKMATNKELYFNKLYENYKILIYSIAFSILKNSENSKDVVQKVYTKIWDIENEKLPKNNEASWLYTLTKNEALDLDKIIDKDYYNRIISKLDIQEQEIISLKILSNMSFKEISQILNIPEGTVKWKYYKSIHTLKLLLGNLGMFIITFAISLKEVILNQKKLSEKTDGKQENTNTTDSSTLSSEQKDVENQEYDSVQEIKNSIQENTTEQVITQTSDNTNNYIKIGFLGIASIFLTFTIIFTIIFIKHQLKGKHKSSK